MKEQFSSSPPMPPSPATESASSSDCQPRPLLEGTFLLPAQLHRASCCYHLIMHCFYSGCHSVWGPFLGAGGSNHYLGTWALRKGGGGGEPVGAPTPKYIGGCVFGGAPPPSRPPTMFLGVYILSAPPPPPTQVMVRASRLHRNLGSFTQVTRKLEGFLPSGAHSVTPAVAV